jgi:transglutaminase/protease-like cytokinesis protein 3
MSWKMFPLVILITCTVCYSPVLKSEDRYHTDFTETDSYEVLEVSQDRLSVIDKHALTAPDAVSEDLKQLSHYLFAPCRNNIEKARAVYAWICNNIVYATWNVGYAVTSSPESVLKSGSSVCSGYSMLFDALCREGGLESVTIEGFAKGTGYLPGDPISNHGNHAWNAVKIGKEWKLIDCTWGSGFVNPRGEFIKRLDDYFFFVPPEELVLTHFPSDRQWQLVKQTVNKDSFVRSLFPKSGYFKKGIQAVSHTDSVVNTRDKRLSLKLKIPEKIDALASLRKPSGEKVRLRPVSVKRHTVQFDIVMNEPGDYYVDLYTGPSGDILELTLHYLIVKQ